MRTIKVKKSFRKHVPLERLIELAKQGESHRSISCILRDEDILVSPSTVQRRLHMFGIKTSSMIRAASKCSIGRSSRAIRYVNRLARFHDCFSTARVYNQLQREGYEDSRKTVKRRLRDSRYLKFGYPRQRQDLSMNQRAARLRWSRTKLAQNINWSKVYFADEKIWLCDGPVRRLKIWYDIRDSKPVLPRKGALSQKIAVWGAFSVDRAPDLIPVSSHVNSEEYCAVLKKGLLPSLRSRNLLLFHDRQTAHHSKRTEAWMRETGVRAELFPPRGADLNPMENLWAIVSKKVFAGTKTYDSRDSLLSAIRVAWASVQKDRGLRDKLANSLTKRLKQVVEKKGGCANY